MRKALILAKHAMDQDEVPVGAILVKDNHLLAASGNASIAHHDPTAHAEILVMREAAADLRNHYLKDTTLYVTLEPCPMCLGAIIQAQIQRIVFGAYDVRLGALGSAFNLLQNQAMIWRPDVLGGVYAKESSELLQRFFRTKRT